MPARVATGAALALTLVLANASRLWAGATAPAARGVFTGQLWGAYDLPQYVEAIREGAAGHLLFEGRVWSIAGGAYLFQTPYLAAGLVLSPLRLDSLAVLEVMRWTGQLAALGSLLLLVRATVPAPLRPWAVVFSTVAGGLGWLFTARPSTPLGPVLPMDVATPSTTLLNGFLAGPHLALMAAALILFAWGFVAVAAGDRRGFLGLVAWPLALTIHPFEVISLLVAAAGAAVLGARRPAVLAYVGIAGLLAAGAAAYGLALVLRHDPVVAIQGAASATTEVGDLPGLLAARAFVLPLAVAALATARRRDPIVVLLVGWAGLSALLNIQPFEAGGPLHRSLEGSAAAFGCLAARGLPVLGARWRPAVLGAVLVSPLVQAAALVVAAPAEAWVPRPIVAVAARARDRHLEGAVLGDANRVRWLVALSGLREAIDDPARAQAEAVRVVSGGSLQEAGADYLLTTDAEPPGLTPVVSVPGAALYR